MGDDEICFVLPRGRSLIFCPFSNVQCSLVPIFGLVESVTTTGLRWNLSKQRMEFGKLISTSNELAHDLVQVESSGPLLWVFDARYLTKK
jgi:thiamine pyrophosphokinase